MSPTYTGKAPSGPAELDPRIIPFFEKFYATSDNPSDAAHSDYVDSLTKDGVMIMGTKKASGADEIMTLRKGLWSGPVKTRYVVSVVRPIFYANTICQTSHSP